MPERSYRVLLYGLALLGLAADQGSKYAVFSWLHGQDQHRYPLIPGAFDLVAEFTNQPDPGGWWAPLRSGDVMPHVNRGALFGMGGEHGSWANGVFAVISLGAAGLIVLWTLRRSNVRDLWLSTALGLILAGTLGNLYDRVVFNGVRDFLHWHGGFDWPVFNIADCCLVVGASLLLLQALWGKAPEPLPATAAANEASSAAV